MSHELDGADSAKAEYEPSTLVEYGDAAELTQGPGNTAVNENIYAS
jgi:hypothetical protein